jgi:glycosyltransferase involved in cell wall biosynthesis
MGKHPRITVFITSYNQRDYLAEAIDSVLAQTLPAFEIMILDDCSCDGSRELISSVAQQHPGVVRAVFHPANLGVARNKAYAQRHARGDWITYLDGDDRYLPHKLEQEWDVMQDHPETRAAYSNFHFIDHEGNRIGTWSEEGQLQPSGDVFEAVFTRDFPGHVVFRNELVARQCIQTVGVYDERRATHEDWDFKLRLSRRYRIAYCPQPAIEYRRYSGGLSQSMADIRLLREARAVYETNRHLLRGLSPPVKARLDRTARANLAHRAEKLLRKMVREQQRRRALLFYGQFRQYLPPRSLARVLLSKKLYSRLTPWLEPDKPAPAGADDDA